MADPLYIVHVLPLLTKGGGERVAVELANHAAQLGHRVTVLAAEPVAAELLQASVHPAIEVRFVCGAPAGRVRRYLRILPWLWENRAWILRQDIVHCHLTYAAVFGTLVGLLGR